MANLRADNLTGTGGRNAIDGSVFFSGYVDGASADWLQIHDNLDDFDMGTGDFTFECWVKAAESSGEYAGIFGMYNYNAAGILIQLSNTGVLRLVAPSAGIDQSGSTVIIPQDGTMGDWHHIAVERSSGTIKGYVNGIEEISHSYGSAINFAYGGSVVIGVTDRTNYPGDYDLKGYISNLRLCKGHTVYNGAFTPPTQKLELHKESVLLCCQDTDDPTADASGRHEIVGFRKCYQGKRYSNIATNGDLETGDTTGWTNGGCSTFEVTTGNSHSGSYSLHCTSDGNGDGVYFSAALNTTLRYKISAYMKCVGPAGTSAKAKMKVGSAFGDSTNYESQTVGYDSYKGFDEWDYVEWIGKATSATTIISFVESSANNVNDWYVDDLKVELWYPEESENILANPNFLTGATGWSFSSTPSGEFTISSNRLNVTDTSRTSDAFATQQLFSAGIKEGRYRITVDYAFATGGFDLGIGNKRIWSITGTSSATHELNAGSSNVNFRLIVGQTGAGYFNSVTLYRIAEPKRINPVPPYGIDEGVVVDGYTKINSPDVMYFPTGDTSQRGRGRGLLMGGAVSPGATNTTQIKYFDIASQGTTDEFGQTTVARRATGSLSSSTRAVMGGGFVAPPSPYTISDVMDYVTIATTANATDFGNMQSTGYSYGTASNETRGLFAGGYRPNNSAVVNTIDLITIASTGNASDFGDLVVARRSFGGLASPTRGIFMGGAPSTKEEIDYVTIATAANAIDFGNLTDGRDIVHGSSSSTRGVMAGGRDPSNTNIIDYITIATTGNATDFGDLLAANYYYASTGNSTRAVWLGDSGLTNTTEYVTIATTGNSIDWGDQGGTPQHAAGACSDSHGGLS